MNCQLAARRAREDRLQHPPLCACCGTPLPHRDQFHRCGPCATQYAEGRPEVRLHRAHSEAARLAELIALPTGIDL